MASSSKPPHLAQVRRICGRHLENVGSVAASSSTSHLFAPEVFMADTEIHRPISSVVERPSADLQRVYRDVVRILPPSPIKAAWRSAMGVGATGVPLPQFQDAPNSGDERYEMFLNSSTDNPPLPGVPRPQKPIFSASVHRARDSYSVSDMR
jgi:hypothetical protein